MAKSRTVKCVDLEGNIHEVLVSDLSWRPSAYGVVIHDDQVLLCRHFGKHNLPGGGIEFGETLEQGLRREVKEETGIDVANPRLLGVTTQLFKPPFDGAPLQTLLLYYACEYVGGQLSMEGFDEEEKIYGEMPEWVPLESLDALQITSTIDYRPYIRQALDAQPSS